MVSVTGKLFIDLQGQHAKTGMGIGHAGGILCQGEVLYHHGGGKAGPIVIICRALGANIRYRAIAVH